MLFSKDSSARLSSVCTPHLFAAIVGTYSSVPVSQIYPLFSLISNPRIRYILGFDSLCICVLFYFPRSRLFHNLSRKIVTSYYRHAISWWISAPLRWNLSRDSHQHFYYFWNSMRICVWKFLALIPGWTLLEDCYFRTTLLGAWSLMQYFINCGLPNHINFAIAIRLP